MAKDFIAIDKNKRIYELSEAGITRLKEMHEGQRLGGWQYGLKSEKNNLLSKIITTKDAHNAIAENAELKERIAQLEQLKDKRSKSEPTEK
jgi:hypothetical protein